MLYDLIKVSKQGDSFYKTLIKSNLDLSFSDNTITILESLKIRPENLIGSLCYLTDTDIFWPTRGLEFIPQAVIYQPEMTKIKTLNPLTEVEIKR
jgi:hypothetical protein